MCVTVRLSCFTSLGVRRSIVAGFGEAKDPPYFFSRKPIASTRAVVLESAIAAKIQPNNYLALAIPNNHSCFRAII